MLSHTQAQITTTINKFYSNIIKPIKIKDIFTGCYIFATLYVYLIVFLVMHPPAGLKKILMDMSRQVVTVDINNIISEFIDISKTKNLNEAELVILVDKFSNKLSADLKSKAIKENLIIVPKQAVIAGGKDYTQEIKNEILKGL